MKIVLKYCWLPLLLFYSCSATKSTYKEENIPVANEFVKAKVERIANLTFGNINYEWKTSDQAVQQDSVSSNVQTNYPNPFSPPTEFKWIVIEPDTFRISIFDIKGNRINSSYVGYLRKGFYKMGFVESNLNSGVYIIMINVGGEKYYRKFVWVK
jgi:hypothetical protein